MTTIDGSGPSPLLKEFEASGSEEAGEGTWRAAPDPETVEADPWAFCRQGLASGPPPTWSSPVTPIRRGSTACASVD
jgi:hypothetical protein